MLTVEAERPVVRPVVRPRIVPTFKTSKPLVSPPEVKSNIPTGWRGSVWWFLWLTKVAFINVITQELWKIKLVEMCPPGKDYSKVWFWQKPGHRWVPYFQTLRYIIVPDRPIRARNAIMPPNVIGVPGMPPLPSGLRPCPAGISFMPMLEYQLPGTLDESTTTADPGTAGASLAVTSRTPFPQTGKFWILVQNSATDSTNREIMRVTAGQGAGAGSFTVVRGQEGTAGVAHPIGSYVAAVIVESLLRLSFRRGYVPDTPFYATATAAGAAAVDAATPIQNALNAANADGGGEMLAPGWLYVSAQITPPDSVTIAGQGMGKCGYVIGDTSTQTPFVISGSTLNTTSLSAVATYGDRSLTFTSITGYAVGDWVIIMDLSAAARIAGWATRIAAIGPGNIVTMEEHCTHDFPTPANTTVYKMSPMISYAEYKDFTVRSVTGDALGQTTRKSGAFLVSYTNGTTFRHVEIVGMAADTSGCVINFDRNRDPRVEDCKFDRCADGDITPSQNTRVVEFRNCTGPKLLNSKFQRSGGSACIDFSATGHAQLLGNEVGGATDWGTGTTASPATTTTGSQTLPLATINVTSTTGFTSTGRIYINSMGISYTGITGTSFTGCSGGTGTIAAGTRVTQNAVNTDGGGRGCKFEDGNTYFIADHNNFHDLAFDGIRTFNSNFGTFTNNQIFGARDVSLYATVGTHGADILISGNTIDRPSSAAGTFHGLYIDQPRCQVVGNKVSNVGASAALFAYTGVGATAIITSNWVHGSGSHAILLDVGVSKAIIQGNVTTSTGGNSINTSGSAGLNRINNNITDASNSLHASDYINDQRTARLTADVSKTTTAASDVTGLNFYVDVNEVERFEFNLFTSAGTGGIKFALTFPTGATVKAEVFGSVAAGAITSERITATATLTTAVWSTSNTSGWVKVMGEIRNGGTAGTVQLQYGSGTNGQTANIQADSTVVATPLA